VPRRPRFAQRAVHIVAVAAVEQFEIAIDRIATLVASVARA